MENRYYNDQIVHWDGEGLYAFCREDGEWYKAYSRSNLSPSNNVYMTEETLQVRTIQFEIGNPAFGTGIKNHQVTKKQIAALQAHIGKNVQLKADRVLGVGRETVKLLSVDLDRGTAQVEVPEWGEETAYLFMFVKLY